MPTIIFIRHTSVNVPLGTCYGQTDVPLSDSFCSEAEPVRRRLSSCLPFDAVYTSPLSRARRLASFCGFTKAKVDNRLMEMDMGEWEMLRYDEIDDPRLQQWYDDYWNTPAAGGESFVQLYERVASFLDEIRLKFDNTKRIAAFTHGGVLLAASLYARLYPQEELFKHQPPYGGIIELQIDSLHSISIKRSSQPSAQN